MTGSATTGDGRSVEDGGASPVDPSPHGDSAMEQLARLAARLLGASAAELRLQRPSPTTGADQLCALVLAGGTVLAVPDASADERTASLPQVLSGEVGSYLGVPCCDQDGQVVGALCVGDAGPRRWSEPEVALLQQLAAAAGVVLGLVVRGAQEETERAVRDLAAEAAAVGTFDWDLRTGHLAWDRRLQALFGYDQDDFGSTIDAFYARLHPEDAPQVGEQLREAIRTCGVFDTEYRVVVPELPVRWVGARGRALGDDHGTAVRFIGAAYDITSRRDAEARVVNVLESMSTAFYSVDTSWRFTYVNAEAERLLGGTRTDLVGGVVWDLFPAAVGTEFETNYRQVMDTGEPVAFDAYYPAPLDAWFEVRAWRSAGGLAVYFLDVTARRRLQQRSDEAVRRSELLDRLTTGLVDTHDPAEAADRLTRLVVPGLADWCMVTLVEDAQQPGRRQGLRHASAWHADPAVQPLVEAYARTRTDHLGEESMFVRALRTGRVQHLPGGATAALRSMLDPGPVRDLLDELAPEAAVVHPLQGRGDIIGVLTLCNGTGRGPFAEADLETMRDVATRAGLVLDNARLYRQQRDLAEGLQRSLFTALPEPDHCHIVARYTPAAEVAQVGGDWYDAFLQPDGATMLVIGDVVGHDTRSAAAMSQVRTLVRGIGAVDDDGPRDLLRTVDRVMQTLQVETTASAVVARLEQSPGEGARGITRLRWSNAGHPPPMVVNPDGTVLALEAVSSDVLLGVDPGTDRRESEVTLDRGATVLMYTDGLVERRGQSLDTGLLRLQDVLCELAAEDRDLDGLCDGVLARMLPEQPEDDVAMVAVRLHRQDEPRPPEAGPRRIPPDVADAPEVIQQPG